MQISGLFIQGSEFDGLNLTRIKENSLEIISLPRMNLFWVDKKKYQELIANTKFEDLLVKYFLIVKIFWILNILKKNNSN